MLVGGLLATPGYAAKNVIVLIPDGCSQSVQTLARWYKGQPLAVDGILVGSVKTYMSNSVITDSASAATAFASGHKTTDGFIGVGPRADDILSTLSVPPESMRYKPLATVLEGARLRGLATGLVATSRITHATPAAYVAHTHSRSLEGEIMEQLVYQNVDVVLGGGKQYLLPGAMGGKRTDGENLLAVVEARGYQVVETRDRLAALSSGRVFGMFAASHMEADIDRAEFAPDQPSLAEMTAKAIELLSKDPDGFFLMVEGSQVDWAGHANDAIYLVTDFLAFDAAVKVALEFAARHGDTLVIAFPDHNTGGLALGNRRSDSMYDSMTVEALIGPLAGMKITSTGLERKIGSDTSAGNIKANLKTWWGIEATDAEVDEILARKTAGLTLDYAISEVMSRTHTMFGWTTHGHTGEDVPLWAYGPDKPAGLVDNTEIAHTIAGALGFDLAKLDSYLFVEANGNFPGVQIDLADPANPVLRVGPCSLPASKNLLIYEPLDLEIPLEGVTVYAEKTGKVYVSGLAAALVQVLQMPFLPSSSAEVQAARALTRIDFKSRLGFVPTLE
jgi:alkaline phosphatase